METQMPETTEVKEAEEPQKVLEPEKAPEQAKSEPAPKRGRPRKAAGTAKRGRPAKAAGAAKRGRPAKAAGAAKALKPRKAGPRKFKRYGAETRSELLAKYESLRSDGLTAQVAAQKVGVPYITLRKWQAAGGKAPGRRGRPPNRTAGRRGRPPAGGSPEQKRSVGKKGAVALVTPSGYRIEDLALEEVIRVLRELK